MDIHRCRFVPYPPSAINALAFSHPSPGSTVDEPSPDLRLAVGRANGDIEIWNPLQGAWFHESTLRGGKDRTIEGLVWTQDPAEDDEEDGHSRPGKLRLFSIGYSTYVTEWDLVTGRPARHSGGNHAEIWCLAAQPRPPSPTDRDQANGTEHDRPCQELAAGCADGAVVLLLTEDGDLKFKRLLAPPSAKKARVLSLVFRDRFTIVAGCADTTIRILDARTGRLIRAVSLGAGPLNAPRDTLVWTVKALPNGDIVSGDSTGEVRFWDGQTYTLLQRLKGHLADILDLEVSADGQTVVSGSMDRRTRIYRRTPGGKGSGRARWSAVTQSRLHEHDVKAMAAFDSKALSVVVSGGLDTTLIVTPLREFGKEHHRTISSVPQAPPVQSAPGKKLVMSWWNREVWIWNFGRPRAGVEHGEPDGLLDSPPRPRLVARIGIKGEENINSASLSDCGTLLAVSTASEIKLFRLAPPKPGQAKSLRVRKVEIPAPLSKLTARHVLFSPDTRLLCIVTPESHVLLARIKRESPSSRDVKVMPTTLKLRRSKGASDMQTRTRSGGALSAYQNTINRIAFSADSSMLVAGDLSGHLDSWVEGREYMALGDADGASLTSSGMEDDDDDDDEDVDRKPGRINIFFGQHWVTNPSGSLIPDLPSAPLILSFRPAPLPDVAGPSQDSELMHPARHAPQPPTHNSSVKEDRLFVLTANHQAFEFEMLRGRLSSWSRRNPPSYFPDEFKGWRDRAMGCIWDMNRETERVWVYASTWLCMFDLSRDFAPDPPTHKGPRKRKRGRISEDGEDLRAHTSGAGSKIPQSELSVMLGKKMRKFEGADPEKIEHVALDTPDPGRGEENEVDVAAQRDLVKTRRGAAGHIDLPNGDTDLTDSGAPLAGESGGAPSGQVQRRTPSFWSTHRYRAILGIVPISQAKADVGDRPMAADGHDEEAVPLEVAVIERPLWDLDLPPRFYGAQDRET